MFFREKKSKKSQNPTLQLVENIRDGGKVKQRIILSLGVGFEIAKSDRQAVARAVEKKLFHSYENGSPVVVCEVQGWGCC